MFLFWIFSCVHWDGLRDSARGVLLFGLDFLHVTADGWCLATSPNVQRFLQHLDAPKRWQFPRDIALVLMGRVAA